jgi:quercetin dioxygenase-like cupin family protein
MRKTCRLFFTAAAIAGLTAAALPATANATPGTGVTSVTLFDHVVGDTDYVLKEITIAPGGSTGWHYHPGPVHGLIKQGGLTHNDADCSIDGSYHAGQTVDERSGPGYVHIGRNLGSTPVVLEVFYQDPVGSPLAVDAPNPGCPFQ